VESFIKRVNAQHTVNVNELGTYALLGSSQFTECVSPVGRQWGSRVYKETYSLTFTHSTLHSTD